ncbi:hypothetical protein CsSME_00044011 [Camellia sinensis var. sinensis]
MLVRFNRRSCLGEENPWEKCEFWPWVGVEGNVKMGGSRRQWSLRVSGDGAGCSA